MSLTATGAAPAANRGGKDIAFAVGIVLILCLFFLPVPAVLIDFGLATSIALSVLILMVALWIQKPLEFSAFPTVLLVATILRLALNISTTRLILSHGEQGPTCPGHHQGRNPHRRGRRALHPRRHSRQADGDRRRSLGRSHQRKGRAGAQARA